MPSADLQPAGRETPQFARGIGHRIALNTLSVVASRGLSLLFSAAAGILLARYLGTRRLGEYGAIYAYLTIYAWVASFGLEWITAREISRRRQEGASILATSVAMSLVTATCAGATALVLAPWAGYTGQLRWLLLFAAGDTLVLTPLRLAGAVFQVDLKQWYSSGINAFRQFLWIGAVVLLVLFRAPLAAVVLARLGCSLMEVALLWGTAARLGMLAGPVKFLTREVRGFFAGALPIAFSTLAVGLYHRIDQVMLHGMVGDARLGPYVVAVNVSELLSTLPVALMSSIFPLLARAFEQDEWKFQRYTNLSFRLLMAIIFFLCAMVTLSAQTIIRVLYGGSFSASAPLLSVLIWSEAAVFFEIVMANTVVARGLQRYLPLATMAGAATNIVLNLAWIPRFGALGSAWATNVSYVIGSAAMFLVFKGTRPLALSGFRSAARPCLLSLAVVGALMTMRIAPWTRAALAIPLYVGGLWMIGGIHQEEIHQLRVVLRQVGASIRSGVA